MSVTKILSDIRRDYSTGSFNENNAAKDPFEQFAVWLQNAIDIKMLEPTAMVLSTVAPDGKPSSRVLLLKKLDERGFVFYTNYESRKGREILENPYAALLFYWDKPERQVRVEGILEKITPEESFEYFKTRPYTSRIGAWASRQSEPLSTRFKLMRQVAQFAAKYPINVPLPPFWGGYRLLPDSFEFWQGRTSRLHDRIKYTKDGDNWKLSRLYP